MKVENYNAMSKKITHWITKKWFSPNDTPLHDGEVIISVRVKHSNQRKSTIGYYWKGRGFCTNSNISLDDEKLGWELKGWLPMPYPIQS